MALLRTRALTLGEIDLHLRYLQCLRHRHAVESRANVMPRTTGLIHDVGRWAPRKAIEDYLRLRPTGLAAVRTAVNVSPMQLRNRDFIAEVEQAINGDAHAAAGLELEITESLIREDVKHSIAS